MRKRGKTITKKKLIRDLFYSALNKNDDESVMEEWDVDIKFPNVLNLLTDTQKMKIVTPMKNQSSFRTKERK